MNKKNLNLGTVLSRNEARKVIGGDPPEGELGGGGESSCALVCPNGNLISITDCPGTCVIANYSVSCNNRVKSC